jgi:predicted Zn finger-like uncharacterized protein
MFTQCSKCETVFRLSADVLRAAGGQVRCGRCGEVFNALQRLAEDASGFTQGESSLDLETRADAILHSAEAVAPVETADSTQTAESAEPFESSVEESGVEIAQLQILDPVDKDLAGETSLEFTLPPGELDRIFIGTPPRPLQRLTAPSHAVQPEHAPATPAAAKPAAAPAASLKRTAGLDVSDVVRQEMLESYAREELPKLNPPRPSLPLLVWLGAAAGLALLLLAQVIYGNRDTGSAALHTSLSAYQLRQWGVTGDPGAKGTLRVRASIMNTAAQLEPYPLLRVTLANRFGTPVGRREFEPAEYLGKPTTQLLEPGHQLDATLDILDPGKDAEGFEIDVCVRGADKKILCASDAGKAK